MHGNVHALEAVLAEVDADVVLFGGDLASGPFPRETIELARALPNARFVRGNADELLAPGLPEAVAERRRWIAAQLRDDDVAWLARLPFAWTVNESLYVHANPIDVAQFVVPGTSDHRVRELLVGVEQHRVVTGHVHLQFEREVDGTRWTGAGSVGCPYVVDDPGAEWAFVDGGEVEFHRTAYDVERTDAAILASGYPRAMEYVEMRSEGARWVATAA